MASVGLLATSSGRGLCARCVHRNSGPSLERVERVSHESVRLVTRARDELGIFKRVQPVRSLNETIGMSTFILTMLLYHGQLPASHR